MSDRKQEIKKLIDNRLKNNDTINCLFQILLINEAAKAIVENLLTKNGYDIYTVDTISGCWSLNDDWYELDNVESIVEYCGVYPVKWDLDDIVLLEDLYYNRDIYINVLWKKENRNKTIKYIPNH